LNTSVSNWLHSQLAIWRVAMTITTLQVRLLGLEEIVLTVKCDATVWEVAGILQKQNGWKLPPQLIVEGRVLESHELVEDVQSRDWSAIVPGLSNGLSQWCDHDLQWEEITFQQSVPQQGMSAKVVGTRGRLLIFPRSPCYWREIGFECERLDAIYTDYEELRMIRSDEFWIVGSDEPTAQHDVRENVKRPYFGVHKLSLPGLGQSTWLRFAHFDGSILTVVCHHGEDPRHHEVMIPSYMPLPGFGTEPAPLRRYRLEGVDSKLLHVVAFQEILPSGGDAELVEYDVMIPCRFMKQQGLAPEEGSTVPIPGQDPFLTVGATKMKRERHSIDGCVKVMVTQSNELVRNPDYDEATMEESFVKHATYTFSVTHVGKPENPTRVPIKYYPWSPDYFGPPYVWAVDDEFLLLPRSLDEYGCDDNMFHKDMQLINWSSGEKIKDIDIEMSCGNRYGFFDRGVLPGSQTFFVVYPQQEGPQGGPYGPRKSPEATTVCFGILVDRDASAPEAEGADEIKVSSKKSPEFYTNLAGNLLQGMEARPKEGSKGTRVAKGLVANLRISGLGKSIGVAVAVAMQIVENGFGVVTKIQTDYSQGKGSNPCARIMIDLERKVRGCSQC